ncbi:3748_t:CDS:2, partial [Funneliformis geosporum]
MVDPYTLQRFFDQHANITNCQLIAMNPKFGQAVMKAIRKLAKKPKEQIIVNEKPDEPENMESNLSKNDTMKRATALYCDAYIDGVKIPLIIDSGSAGCIISLKLLKDLEMVITQASKTIMVNVNGEKRRPLGAVTKIPLKINNHIIPFDASNLQDKNKLEELWKGPYIIHNVLGNGIYKIRIIDDKVLKIPVNSERLK